MTILRRIVIALAAGWILLVGIAALAPSLITGIDPLAVDMGATKLPPSAEHLFGTDQSGRDVFARVVHGASASLGVAALATATALVVGLILGTLLGVAPRAIDAVVMRIVDIALAIPEFLVALVLVALLGPGQSSIALAVTVAAVPVYLRYARAHTRSVREEEYVRASVGLGVAPPVVILRHVVPDVARRLSVLATLGLGTSILAVSGLSFLGLGVTEPQPEWGLILSSGRNLLATAGWIALFPGITITLTVLAASYLGRVLRASVEGVTA